MVNSRVAEAAAHRDGLTKRERDDVRWAARVARADGTTIVMSTHVMHQVEEMGDRLLMLDHGKPVLYGAVQDVRNRFAEHAVVVEGEGDWQALPSVSHVEAEDNGRSVRLHLADGVSSDQLMQALATNPAYHVRSFTLAVPSLNDIFIQVAGRNGNHA